MVPVSPAARKLLLTSHVLASVGWAGALAVFLAHALGALFASDPAVARGLAIAMALGAWFVILPLSVLSLATGIVQSLVSAWGLARHYWVVFKLVLTVIATGVLLLKLGPISFLAAAGTAPDASALQGLRGSLAWHAAGGLAVLAVATVLAVWKPPGLTPLGARALGLQSGPPPRWVRLLLWATAATGLVLGLMFALGGHGPGAHLPR